MAELEARQPGSTKGRGPDKWDFVPPGKDAESYQMLLERVRPFFEELRKPTICVTHGGVIRALFRMVAKLPKAEAARVETPQDRILRLKDGRLDWL
jgi:probable phosphoglycerate mutase